MRKHLLAGVTAFSLFAAVTPAHAQIVGTVTFCTNCSSAVLQVEEAAQNAWRWGQDLLYQVQQLEQQIQSVQWLIQNTVSLPQRLINDITSPIYQAQALVRQAEMLGQNTKWMITNLNVGRGYGGYGGSLDDIPRALAQESNAIANAMQQLGLVSRQVSSLSAQCAAQYAVIDNFDPGGIKSATMAGTAMSATAGQCAEARAQQQAAYQNAMATAELRRVHQESMMAAASQAHLDATLRATCASLTSGGGHSRACEQ